MFLASWMVSRGIDERGQDWRILVVQMQAMRPPRTTIVLGGVSPVPLKIRALVMAKSGDAVWSIQALLFLASKFDEVIDL